MNQSKFNRMLISRNIFVSMVGIYLGSAGRSLFEAVDMKLEYLQRSQH
jgi:hypothetical protein